MEYQIILNELISQLEEDVREAISRGWVPQGGAAIFITGAGSMFAQAMIRTPNELGGY